MATVSMETIFMVTMQFPLYFPPSIPVRTYFDHLSQGTISVAVSYDSKYVATIGITMPQVVSIWDWTDERDTPIHTINIPPEYGLQVNTHIHTYVHVHVCTLFLYFFRHTLCFIKAMPVSLYRTVKRV